MNRTSIGLVGVFAAAVLGFLPFRAGDRYIYEHGINLNLKLVAVVIAVLLLAVAAFLAARARRRRHN